MTMTPLQKTSPSRVSRIEKWVPGVRAIRTYQRPWLPRDLAGAVVLPAFLIAQDMTYAELAGWPAVTGLYTTVVYLVAYFR